MRALCGGLSRLQKSRLLDRGMPSACGAAFRKDIGSYAGQSLESSSRMVAIHADEGSGWRICRNFSEQATSSANSPEDTEGCWSCEAVDRDPDSLFCPNCGVIMPVDSKTSHHSLMSMKEGSYAIDHKLLERQYKRLQRQLHPDRFTRKSETERGLSEDASSRVNEAYSTLKDPLKRGQYLLDQQDLGAGEGVIENPELLTTVMGAREAIEDTEDEQVLRKYNEIFDLQSKSCVQALAVAFEHDDMQKAKNLVTSLRYISNIQAAILEKL